MDTSIWVSLVVGGASLLIAAASLAFAVISSKNAASGDYVRQLEKRLERAEAESELCATERLKDKEAIDSLKDKVLALQMELLDMKKGQK